MFESMQKCKKGVMWKGSAAHYVLNGLEETLKLEKQLKTGTYKARQTTKFRVTYPKPRDIVSICFRDRVYQRSLNDNAIYPAMTKSFIQHNCACQKDKGTDYARAVLDEFLHRHYRKYGRAGGVLQVDVHGYYPNISIRSQRTSSRNTLSRTSTSERRRYWKISMRVMSDIIREVR